jgi:hypothetical protein
MRVVGWPNVVWSRGYLELLFLVFILSYIKIGPVDGASFMSGHSCSKVFIRLELPQACDHPNVVLFSDGFHSLVG